MAAIRGPREVIDVRAVEVGDAMLAGAIGASKPDLPRAGAIADKGNLPIGRVRGIAITGGGSNQVFRLPPALATR